MLLEPRRFPLAEGMHFNVLASKGICSRGVNDSHESFTTYCGICPERALCTVLAGSPGRAGVLAEVVVAVDGSPAEVAHLSAAAAGHAVAAL